MFRHASLFDKGRKKVQQSVDTYFRVFKAVLNSGAVQRKLSLFQHHTSKVGHVLGKSVSQDSPILQFDTTPPQSHSIFLNTPGGVNMLSISPREIFSWTRLTQINCENQPSRSYLNSSYWIFKWNKNLSLESKSSNSRVRWQSTLKLRRAQRCIPSDVWDPILLRTARSQNLVIFVF